MPVRKGTEFVNVTEADLRTALKAGGNIAGAARLLGVNWMTVHARMEKYGIPSPATPSMRVDTDELLNVVGAPGLTGTDADKAMVSYLEAKGYLLSKNVRQENRQFVRKTKNFTGETFTVGVVADTHLCSKYQQTTALEAAYDYFVEHNIDTVLHAGDLSAGNGRMYRGQVYELHKQGYDEQVVYVRNTYPRRDSIQTLVIAGNHDASWLKGSGGNIVSAVCNDRPDMTYLGLSGAFIDLHGIQFYIMHPTGGVTYARSYRLQKFIEQMAPQMKPQVFLVGHYHVTNVLECYRNVYAAMLGCFEAQTPYLLEKGLYPEVGFTTLTITANEGDLISVSKTWLPFFEPIAEDY